MPLKLLGNDSATVETNDEVCQLLREYLVECESSPSNGIIIISLDKDGNPNYSYSTLSVIEVIGSLELVMNAVISDHEI